jgi:hypothetical protein
VVSLSEAYRYAYDRTLSSTMRTAVGRQHVTLETALAGHGDVPITYPAQASAQLELQSDLAADVLIEHEVAVVAELHKVGGGALRLALPAGSYTVVLREGGALSSCAVQLSDGAVTPLQRSRCSALDQDEAQAKGYFVADDEADHRPREAWGLELGLGLGNGRHGAFTDRLEDFSFVEQQFVEGAAVRWSIAGTRQLNEHLSAVLDLRNLDIRRYERDLLSTEDETKLERFAWWSYALGLHLRAHVDLGGDRFRLFAQVGGGIGYVHSKLDDDVEADFGPHLALAAGAYYMPWKRFGFGAQLGYVYAPMLSNEIGDHHDSGGLALTLNLRFRTWETP